MLLSIGRARRLRFHFNFTSRLRAVFARLLEIRQAVEGRRAISRMDARMLSDIGLSHGQAVEEASRRPWDTQPRL